jgi:hypothetical protein
VDFLDIFALFVLLTLLMTVLAGALVLGWLPGRIAARRNHPQADAVRVCGWIGLITFGVLLPLAYVWAYLRPVHVGVTAGTDPGAPMPRGPDPAAELKELKGRLAVLEAKLQGNGPHASPSTRGSGPTATKGERI